MSHPGWHGDKPPYDDQIEGIGFIALKPGIGQVGGT